MVVPFGPCGQALGAAARTEGVAELGDGENAFAPELARSLSVRWERRLRSSFSTALFPASVVEPTLRTMPVENRVWRRWCGQQGDDLKNLPVHGARQCGGLHRKCRPFLTVHDFRHAGLSAQGLRECNRLERCQHLVRTRQLVDRPQSGSEQVGTIAPSCRIRWTSAMSASQPCARTVSPTANCHDAFSHRPGPGNAMSGSTAWDGQFPDALPAVGFLPRRGPYRVFGAGRKTPPSDSRRHLVGQARNASSRRDVTTVALSRAKSEVAAASNWPSKRSFIHPESVPSVKRRHAS